MASPGTPRPAMTRVVSCSRSTEKDLPAGAVDYKDHGEAAINSADDGGSDAIDAKEVAKTLRKMDLIIMPMMTIILAFCYIDRTNMGLAMVVGMGKELHFGTYEYSIALLVFFPGYAIAALPSNYVLAKVPVRYWLTLLSVLFGLLTLGCGFVREFAGLASIRAFLGVCEAGVYPTVVMVLSSWYPRYHFGKRMAVVGCGASLISALSGVLAWAFSRISTPNYSGWRWIFILEGSITTILALGAFFVLDEYPSKSKFLNAEQRRTAVRMIAEDREELEDQKLTVGLVFECLRDWKIWIFGVVYMFSVAATYGLAYFVPLILNQRMGYSGAISQLMSTPPYFYAFILAVGLVTVSDRWRMRSPFVIFLQLNVVLGITLTRWGPNTGSQYLGLFFCIGASIVNGPLIVIYAQNNAPTRAKRSVSSGLQLSFGALGGIIGSTVFRSQDAPTYTPGIIVVLCFSAAIIAICSLMNIYLNRLNRLQKETGVVLEDQRSFLYTP